jgi:hypothetical protein
MSGFYGPGGASEATNLLIAEDTERIADEAESTDPVEVEWPHGEDNTPALATFDFSWTVDTNALASGDVMVTAAHEIADFFLTTTSLNRLLSVTIHDADDQGVAMDLYLLTAGTSLGTQNGAPSITDGNGEAISAVIPVDTANYYDLTAFKKAFIPQDQIPVRLLKGGGASTSIWLTGVVRAAATYAGGTLKLRIAVERFA